MPHTSPRKPTNCFKPDKFQVSFFPSLFQLELAAPFWFWRLPSCRLPWLTVQSRPDHGCGNPRKSWFPNAASLNRFLGFPILAPVAKEIYQPSEQARLLAFQIWLWEYLDMNMVNLVGKTCVVKQIRTEKAGSGPAFTKGMLFLHLFTFFLHATNPSDSEARIFSSRRLTNFHLLNLPNHPDLTVLCTIFGGWKPQFWQLTSSSSRRRSMLSM